MRILHWYILKQHLVPLLLGFGVVTFILEMDVLFDYLDLVINRGVAPLVGAPALRALPGLHRGAVGALRGAGGRAHDLRPPLPGQRDHRAARQRRQPGLHPRRPAAGGHAAGGGPHVLQRPGPARVQPRLRQPAHRHRPHAAHGEAPGGRLHHRLPGLQPAGPVRERAHQRDAGRDHLPDERRRAPQPHPGQARLPDLHPRRPHGRARTEGRGDPRDPGRRGRLAEVPAHGLQDPHHPHPGRGRHPGAQRTRSAQRPRDERRPALRRSGSR